MGTLHLVGPALSVSVPVDFECLIVFCILSQDSLSRERTWERLGTGVSGGCWNRLGMEKEGL